MGGFRSPEIREPEPGCEQLGVPRGVAIDGFMPRAQELKLWHFPLRIQLACVMQLSSRGRGQCGHATAQC